MFIVQVGRLIISVKKDNSHFSVILKVFLLRLKFCINLHLTLKWQKFFYINLKDILELNIL